MHTKAVSLSLLLVVFATGCNRDDQPAEAPVRVVTDNYYGVEVKDPYRYMENMDDTVFLKWMKQYAEYSRKVLDEIPGRENLVAQMRDFDSRVTGKVYSLKITESGRYFYMKITPEDEKGKVFFREGYEGSEVMLFDPDDYKNAEGLNYVVSGIFPTDDGRVLGISVSPNGSESNTMLIMDIETRRFFSDEIHNIMGSCSWLPEGEGFIYTKSNSDDIHDPERFLNMKSYFHRTGTPQSDDRMIFSSDMAPEVQKRPEELPFVHYDHHNDETILMLYTVERYVKVYHKPGSPLDNVTDSWQKLIGAEDQIQKYYIRGDDLYLYTARDAPNFKILKTSKDRVDIEGAEVVVPEPADAMISGFSFTDEALYYTLKYNGVEERLFRLPMEQDNPEEVRLPAAAGSLGVITRGHHFSDIWVIVTGWTLDGKRYRYHAQDDTFTPEPLSSEASYPEYKNLVVEQLMVESHDGTRVPLSIIYREGTPLNGTAPLMMTGYGAYGISRRPSFNPYQLIWTMHGGIFAVAHVRGGGELGDNWRLSGHKSTKPNTWKDFIACAEYLIGHDYTSSEHMAIYGGSAGGVLIGRSMTERPDLFAAAIPIVGLMNALRMEESPNGPANTPEFGTVKDSAECMALLEMDAYHHIRDGVDYPATLVVAGFNDPRVIVWQPAKFAARLQAANSSGHPILFDVDYTSGHGLGDTKSKSFADLADLLAFSFWQTGHPEFQKE